MLDAAGRFLRLPALCAGQRFPAHRLHAQFRVADLEAMAAQLAAMGVAVEVDPAEWPNGRFATLSDPEGNPIQLWQETA
jgi:predicted enzyme related to lactoylglutathione lyase